MFPSRKQRTHFVVGQGRPMDEELVTNLQPLQYQEEILQVSAGEKEVVLKYYNSRETMKNTVCRNWLI